MHRKLKIAFFSLAIILSSTIILFVAFFVFGWTTISLIQSAGGVSSSGGPFVTSPSLTTDTAYFMDKGMKMKLLGIDTKTGARIREIKSSKAFGFRLVDDLIYQFDYDSSIHKIDAISGRELNKYKTNIKSFGDCFSAENKLLIKDSSNKTITSYDSKTLKPLWKYVANNDVFNDLVINNNVVCFSEGLNSSCIRGVDLDTGKLLWTFKIGTIDGQAVGVSQKGILYTGSSAGTNGFVSGGNLYALNINTGKELWCHKPADQEGVASNIVISNDLLFFISAKNNLYAVNMKTGHVKWSYSPQNRDDRECSQIVADNNKVYFAQDNGQIYALDAKSGKVQWKTKKLSKISDNSFQIFNNILFVGASEKDYRNDTGELFALEADTGNIKWIYELK